MLKKNTLIVALIAALPTLAQDATTEAPAAPAPQAPHWGAHGQMPGRPNRADMHKRMLEKFDLDKDGQLNDEEKAAMKAEMQKRRAERGPRGPRPEGGMHPGNRRRPHSERPEMIKKYDTDQDGQLSEEERAALRNDVKAGREARREKFHRAFMERFDTNKDGVLSEEEKEAAKAARGEGRRGHRRPGRPFGPRPEGMPEMPQGDAPEAPESNEQ